MKHLIICREYPPAPSGGIGTYALHLSRLLAESGEVVHVIGQMWAGADKQLEETCNGRLIVHRVPMSNRTLMRSRKPTSALESLEAKSLFASDFPPQCFAWQAGLLAERLVEQEAIDVIEAQEFEAPLYYFQLRRALGVGPKKQPPCIVHLHSPMEFIVLHNDWEIGEPYFLTAKRLEDYSIAAADALLCPSQYFARQAETHYGLREGTIRVIPHPVGDTPVLERGAKVWKNGKICYVGRLERRKGVIEWLEAAASVAPEFPEAEFDFVGANILDKDEIRSRALIESLIPRKVRPRFHFHGHRPLSSRGSFLCNARIAVVPSRWENFPYTCVEAMSSGLPVLASSQGGMVEMISDGRSGWLASDSRSDSLASGLRRALQTPPADLAEMGQHAARDIRRLCDNTEIIEKHRRFRKELAVSLGPKISAKLPANLPWTQKPAESAGVERRSKSHGREGVAVVVIPSDDGVRLHESLRSLRQQTQKPIAVAVVYRDRMDAQTEEYIDVARREGWQSILETKAESGAAKNAGINAIMAAGLKPSSFAFLNAGDTLEAGYIATCESVLQKLPEVGLVSCWIHHSRGRESKVFAVPTPSFPYQWLSNDAVPFSLVRSDALMEVGMFRADFTRGFENWYLFNAVMAAGWVAVTIPQILGRHHGSKNSTGFVTMASSYWTMRREFLEKFAAELAQEAKEILLLSESHVIHSHWGDLLALQKKLLIARVLLTNPARTAAAIGHRIRRKFRLSGSF